MKHIHETEFGPGADDFITPKLSDRVFGLQVNEGEVTFSELCDGYFTIEMPKQDAIQMLNEMIEYIHNEELK